MDVKETQISLPNTKNTLAMTQEKVKAAMGVINKLRVVQGWNLMPPKDAEPIAAIWIEQFNHAGIESDEYASLLQKAIDWRIESLRLGTYMPTLTIETLIAAKGRVTPNTNMENYRDPMTGRKIGEFGR